LRWSLRDLGVPPKGDGLACDVRDRLLRWLDDAAAGTEAAPVDRSTALAALPGLLVGRELAGARLIIASFDLELSGAALGPLPASVQG